MIAIFAMITNRLSSGPKQLKEFSCVCVGVALLPGLVCLHEKRKPLAIGEGMGNCTEDIDIYGICKLAQ